MKKLLLISALLFSVNINAQDLPPDGKFIIHHKNGETYLTGEVKNVGNKRADFSKIIFTFRMNWQGESKSLTTFINGVANTFNTGISSDNSILPHAIGNFELIIPKSFGIFIGYTYDVDWSQYD